MAYFLKKGCNIAHTSEILYKLIFVLDMPLLLGPVWWNFSVEFLNFLKSRFLNYDKF